MQQSNDFEIPAREKAQSTAVKLEILRTTCGDQAVQATSEGRFLDAADWRHLRKRILNLK